MEPNDKHLTRYKEGVNELCKAIKALHLKILESSWDTKDKVSAYQDLCNYAMRLESEAKHNKTESVVLDSQPSSPEVSNCICDEFMETSDNNNNGSDNLTTKYSLLPPPPVRYKRTYDILKRNETDAMYKGITIRTLVEHGFLKVGEVLEARYFGNFRETKIDARGYIGTEGTRGYTIHPTGWILFEVG